MKGMKINWFFWTIIAVVIIGAGFLIFSKFSGDDTTVCKTDSDCVPTTCCHSMLCTTQAFAPQCNDIFCSQECVPDTLDCGQASCACQDGICLAKPN